MNFDFISYFLFNKHSFWSDLKILGVLSFFYNSMISIIIIITILFAEGEVNIGEYLLSLRRIIVLV